MACVWNTAVSATRNSACVQNTAITATQFSLYLDLEHSYFSYTVHSSACNWNTARTATQFGLYSEYSKNSYTIWHVFGIQLCVLETQLHQVHNSAVVCNTAMNFNYTFWPVFRFRIHLYQLHNAACVRNTAVSATQFGLCLQYIYFRHTIQPVLRTKLYQLNNSACVRNTARSFYTI